jgi:hypothetical protein
MNNMISLFELGFFTKYNIGGIVSAITTPPIEEHVRDILTGRNININTLYNAEQSQYYYNLSVLLPIAIAIKLIVRHETPKN